MTLRPIVLQRLFVVSAVSWAASLFLAAYAASGLHGETMYGFALAVYGLGNWICHQRPERSFHLWSVQLPVCARCTGIYIGAAVAAAAGRPRALASRPAVALALAAVPSVITLLYEWMTGQTPSNWIRAAAGVPLGAAVAIVVLGELSRLRWDAPLRAREVN